MSVRMKDYIFDGPDGPDCPDSRESKRLRTALEEIHKLATSGSPWLWAGSKIAMTARKALEDSP